MNTKPEEETHSNSTGHYQPPPSSSSSSSSSSKQNPPPPQPESEPNSRYTEKPGTHVMGPVLSSIPPPSCSTKREEETHSNSNIHHQPPPLSSTPNAPPPESNPNNNNTEKWGTHVMGPPAAPSSHPDNKKASLWRAEEHQAEHPYVQHSPIEHKSTHNPLEPAIHVFNSWTNKAESLSRNIWQNLKTSSSLSDAVYGKMGLTTKVITGGGFESLYKQTFTTVPNEKLKKTFACYLSTSTGPVAGTLYLSDFHVAFCSDRPLSFIAPSGQQAWSYYKAIVPLEKLNSVDPISMTDNRSEKYIKIDTVDGHDFWFMGFVNYDKASLHLSQSCSEFITTAATAAAQPVGGSVAG